VTAEAIPTTGLPIGVELFALEMHRDSRGCLTEVFREEWDTGVSPVQWNVVSSEAGVLRGVHVHPRHDDYLIVVQGESSAGLRDLRRGSPTEGMAAVVPVSGDELTAIKIPHGVAHGFYFHVPSVHVYAVTSYWDRADELGCHWADPELAIPWPTSSAPSLSETDTTAQSLQELLNELEPLQPIAWSA
jgi:dTDP-4-dehydrorhamnose 3,5-epimerase